MPVTSNSPSTVLDTDLIKETTYLLLENGNADATGNSLLTAMFTINQIVDALDQKQQRFLLDTGCVVTQATQVTTAGVGQYNLPVTNITPRRVSFTDAASSQIRSLTRLDTWELDHGSPGWQNSPGNPVSWYETTQPTETIGIAPAPSAIGQLNMLLVELATLLTGAGIAMAIPDDWTPYILWGALGDLLSQSGAPYDPIRAQWCYQRYTEGVEMCRLILGGSA